MRGYVAPPEDRRVQLEKIRLRLTGNCTNGKVIHPFSLSVSCMKCRSPEDQENKDRGWAHEGLKGRHSGSEGEGDSLGGRINALSPFLSKWPWCITMRFWTLAHASTLFYSGRGHNSIWTEHLRVLGPSFSCRGSILDSTVIVLFCLGTIVHQRNASLRVLFVLLIRRS